jgi:hypothetical protein
MAADSDQAKASKRFDPRLSLRMSMGLVLLVGVWMGTLVRQADRQRAAVTAITRAGGSVYYSWEFVGGTLAGGELPGGRPWAPLWLVSLLGPDYFGRVISAQIEACGTDEILDEVARLDGLEQLSLLMSGVTDDGMRRIARLDRLQELYLQETAIGDAGLRHLKSLPRLRLITLPNRVTDQGLDRLARLRGLRTIFIHRELSCPLLTEKGVQRLRRARQDLLIDPR